jgi:CheY-like chemotaxis protein
MYFFFELPPVWKLILAFRFKLKTANARNKRAGGNKENKNVYAAQVPVIVVTAYAMSTDQKMAFDAGCNLYLPKPVKKEVLLNKLRQYSFIA